MRHKGASAERNIGVRLKFFAGALLYLTFDTTLMNDSVPISHFGLSGVYPYFSSDGGKTWIWPHETSFPS